VPKMQTLTERVNEKFHKLIDFLTKRKMYGEVTFYMQAGNIESCRISERHTKNEIDALVDGEAKVLTPAVKAVVNAGV